MSSDKNELIYGRKPILEALLDKNVSIEKIFIQKGLHADILSKIAREAFFQKIPLIHVPAEKINTLSQENHQGIVATVAQVQYFTMDELLNVCAEKANPIVLVLDEITDVRNFGAIARSAQAFEVDGIIIGTKNNAPINSESIKASAGNILKAKIVRALNLENTIDKLKNAGFMIVATALLRGAESVENIDASQPIALVIGNEENGVRPTILEKADMVCKIPMSKRVESLNVSVATGIVLYELYKQK